MLEENIRQYFNEDINQRTEEGKSYLHYMKYKKDVNNLFEKFNFKVFSGEDYSELNYECTKELINILPLEKLSSIKINPSLISKSSKNNLMENLHDIEKIKYLISIGLDINNRDNIGNVIYINCNDEVKYLLIKSGLNINNINDYGKSLLFYEENIKLLELLLEGSKVINQQCFNDGKSCFFDTQKIKNSSIAIKKDRLLIEHGIDVNLKDKLGKTALLFNKPEVIQLLILENGFDIHTKTNNGSNMLFFNNVSIKTTEKMIEKNIDIHHTNNEGLNALLFSKTPEKASLLIRSGIRFQDININSLPNHILKNIKEIKQEYFEYNIKKEKEELDIILAHNANGQSIKKRL